jgi:hypothetical protein
LLTTITKTIPDGGAEATVGGMDVLRDLGLSEKYLTSSTFNLVMADKTLPLLVVGEKEYLTDYEGVTANITIMFSPDVEGLLLSCYDFVDLGILHENYPRPWRKQQLSSQISAVGAIPSRSKPIVYQGPVPLEPTAEDIQRIEADIVKEFTAVFDQSGSLNFMEGPEMIIELKDDAEPFYVNGARPIPFADRPEVKRLLDEYVAKCILIPVTEASDWALPLVVARKADNSLRLFVDHTRLNRHVRRPTHPTRTPRDAVTQISGDATFFTTFDAANGYFQIPLHLSSQHLTIFMTQWGRYKFLRALGLCSSSEEYNRRADQAFQDVNNTVRVVDDLLRFDSSFPENVAGVCALLSAARSAGITFSLKKFHFARSQIQ